MLRPDRFTFSKPLEDRSLRVFLRISEDLPDWHEQFVTMLKFFLTEKKPTGCLLAKSQKTEERLERRQKTGKSREDFKLKGHVVGFGHKVKWDHDLIDLCWVYVRVRSLETYSSTLVVVDTIDIAFRNNLFIILTPQPRLQTVVP
ncbi:hypothetical protein VTN49DRAFT_638 [Thermomyces lanuginosus]|uniref:uncharacterized protein n=1 Tax=Thermomyces lanuginosus TaxID=5541 RepID=UPI0037432DD8